MYADAWKENKKLNDKIVIHAGYFPLRDSNKPEIVEYSDSIRKDVGFAISYITDAMKKGYFFQTAECEYCDYGSICSSYAGMQVQRKFQNDPNPMLEKYKEIKEFE